MLLLHLVMKLRRDLLVFLCELSHSITRNPIVPLFVTHLVSNCAQRLLPGLFGLGNHVRLGDLTGGWHFDDGWSLDVVWYLRYPAKKGEV